MKQLSAAKITGYIGLISLLVCLFYFLRAVDITLIYYWQQTVPRPFGESLQTAGGIAGLLGDMLLELMARPSRGSVGVALLVALVFFSFLVVFRDIKANPLLFPLLLAALIPFILLFAHYTLPAGLVMCMATGFVLAAIQSLYSPRKLLIRTLYNFITGMVVYFVAGAAGLLVFLQVIIIRVVLSKKYLELVSTLPLFIVPILYLLINLSYTIKFAYLGSFQVPDYSRIPQVLYVSLFSPLILLLIFAVLNGAISRFTLKRPVLITGPAIILVIIVLIFSSRANVSEHEKSILRTVQASSQRDWEKVLDLNKEQLYMNNVVQFELNRALYQTGQLLDNLFHYPQEFGERGIFLESTISSSLAIQASEFYYDMRYANETRHWAAEAHMGFMRHPIVLKNLVISYIAIGIEEAALKYLAVLSRSRLHKEWCDQVYDKIEKNTILDDPVIRSFINNNPEKDYFASSSRIYQKLKLFYSQNPENKMAFEYIIVCDLLRHRIGNVVAFLPEFRNFGYEMLPRVVEEAVLIYLSRKPEGNPSMAGYSMRVKTVEEFRDFSILVTESEGRAEKMNKASKYRNTYWYYLLFTSPHSSQNSY